MMKRKVSMWQLLVVVGVMMILVVGLWSTFGNGLKLGSQVLAADVPEVTAMTPRTGAQRTAPVIGTGAAGQVAFWTGTQTLSGSNSLQWNSTNTRLGIGDDT